MTGDATPWLCREVRQQLPSYLAGEMHGIGERGVRKHLQRCAECAAERERQEQVAAGLAALRAERGEPPAGLLDDLLETARRPGLRGRAARPARGAVSGARPELSAAFLVAGAVASTGMGWAAWRGARWARTKISRHH